MNPDLGSHVYIYMLVLDLEDSIQLREKKGWHKTRRI